MAYYLRFTRKRVPRLPEPLTAPSDWQKFDDANIDTNSSISKELNSLEQVQNTEDMAAQLEKEESQKESQPEPEVDLTAALDRLRKLVADMEHDIEKLSEASRVKELAAENGVGVPATACTSASASASAAQCAAHGLAAEVPDSVSSTTAEQTTRALPGLPAGPGVTFGEGSQPLVSPHTAVQDATDVDAEQGAVGGSRPSSSAGAPPRSSTSSRSMSYSRSAVNTYRTLRSFISLTPGYMGQAVGALLFRERTQSQPGQQPHPPPQQLHQTSQPQPQPQPQDPRQWPLRPPLPPTEVPQSGPREVAPPSAATPWAGHPPTTAAAVPAVAAAAAPQLDSCTETASLEAAASEAASSDGGPLPGPSAVDHGLERGPKGAVQAEEDAEAAAAEAAMAEGAPKEEEHDSFSEQAGELARVEAAEALGSGREEGALRLQTESEVIDSATTEEEADAEPAVCTQKPVKVPEREMAEAEQLTEAVALQQAAAEVEAQQQARDGAGRAEAATPTSGCEDEAPDGEREGSLKDATAAVAGGGQVPNTAQEQTGQLSPLGEEVPAFPVEVEVEGERSNSGAPPLEGYPPAGKEDEDEQPYRKAAAAEEKAAAAAEEIVDVQVEEKEKAQHHKEVKKVQVAEHEQEEQGKRAAAESGPEPPRGGSLRKLPTSGRTAAAHTSVEAGALPAAAAAVAVTAVGRESAAAEAGLRGGRATVTTLGEARGDGAGELATSGDEESEREADVEEIITSGGLQGGLQVSDDVTESEAAEAGAKGRKEEVQFAEDDSDQQLQSRCASPTPEEAMPLAQDAEPQSILCAGSSRAVDTDSGFCSRNTCPTEAAPAPASCVAPSPPATTGPCTTVQGSLPHHVLETPSPGSPSHEASYNLVVQEASFAVLADLSFAWSQKAGDSNPSEGLSLVAGAVHSSSSAANSVDWSNRSNGGGSHDGADASDGGCRTSDDSGDEGGRTAASVGSGTEAAGTDRDSVTTVVGRGTGSTVPHTWLGSQCATTDYRLSSGGVSSFSGEGGVSGAASPRISCGSPPPPPPVMLLPGHMAFFGSPPTDEAAATKLTSGEQPSEPGDKAGADISVLAVTATAVIKQSPEAAVLPGEAEEKDEVVAEEEQEGKAAETRASASASAAAAAVAAAAAAGSCLALQQHSDTGGEFTAAAQRRSEEHAQLLAAVVQALPSLASDDSEASDDSASDVEGPAPWPIGIPFTADCASVFAPPSNLAAIRTSPFAIHPTFEADAAAAAAAAAAATSPFDLPPLNFPALPPTSSTSSFGSAAATPFECTPPAVLGLDCAPQQQQPEPGCEALSYSAPSPLAASNTELQPSTTACHDTLVTTDSTSSPLTQQPSDSPFATACDTPCDATACSSPFAAAFGCADLALGLGDASFDFDTVSNSSVECPLDAGSEDSQPEQGDSHTVTTLKAAAGAAVVIAAPSEVAGQDAADAGGSAFASNEERGTQSGPETQPGSQPGQRPQPDSSPDPQHELQPQPEKKLELQPQPVAVLAPPPSTALRRAVVAARERRALEDQLIVVVAAAPPSGGADTRAHHHHDRDHDNCHPQHNQHRQECQKEQQPQRQDATPVAEHLGFHGGMPLAAVIVFRYCLHSRALDAEGRGGGGFLDRVESAWSHQVDEARGNINLLSYWMSVSAALAQLLDGSGPAPLPLSASASGPSTRSSGSGSSSSSGGGGGGCSGSGSGGGSGGGVGAHGEPGPSALEAPAGPRQTVLQPLQELVRKAFTNLYDVVRQEVSPLLAGCVCGPTVSPSVYGNQAVSRGCSCGGGSRDSGTSGGGCSVELNLDLTSSAAGSAGGSSEVSWASSQAANASHRPWLAVLRMLDALMRAAEANHVPRALRRALLARLLRAINAELLNSLLSQPESCAFTNGVYLQTGLRMVAKWLGARGAAVGGCGCDGAAATWDELQHVRQAATFIVFPRRDDEKILHPVLTTAQLLHLATSYRDDLYDDEKISDDVLEVLRAELAAGGGRWSSGGGGGGSCGVPLLELPSASLHPSLREVTELLAADRPTDKELYSMCGKIRLPETLRGPGSGVAAAAFRFLETWEAEPKSAKTAAECAESLHCKGTEDKDSTVEELAVVVALQHIKEESLEQQLRANTSPILWLSSLVSADSTGPQVGEVCSAAVTTKAVAAEAVATEAIAAEAVTAAAIAAEAVTTEAAATEAVAAKAVAAEAVAAEAVAAEADAKTAAGAVAGQVVEVAAEVSAGKPSDAKSPGESAVAAGAAVAAVEAPEADVVLQEAVAVDSSEAEVSAVEQAVATEVAAVDVAAALEAAAPEAAALEPDASAAAAPEAVASEAAAPQAAAPEATTAAPEAAAELSAGVQPATAAAVCQGATEVALADSCHPGPLLPFTFGAPALPSPEAVPSTEKESKPLAAPESPMCPATLPTSYLSASRSATGRTALRSEAMKGAPLLPYPARQSSRTLLPYPAPPTAGLGPSGGSPGAAQPTALLARQTGHPQVAAAPATAEATTTARVEAALASPSVLPGASSPPSFGYGAFPAFGSLSTAPAAVPAPSKPWPPSFAFNSAAPPSEAIPTPVFNATAPPAPVFTAAATSSRPTFTATAPPPPASSTAAASTPAPEFALVAPPLPPFAATAPTPPMFTAGAPSPLMFTGTATSHSKSNSLTAPVHGLLAATAPPPPPPRAFTADPAPWPSLFTGTTASPEFTSAAPSTSPFASAALPPLQASFTAASAPPSMFVPTALKPSVFGPVGGASGPPRFEAVAAPPPTQSPFTALGGGSQAWFRGGTAPPLAAAVFPPTGPPTPTPGASTLFPPPSFSFGHSIAAAAPALPPLPSSPGSPGMNTSLDFTPAEPGMFATGDEAMWAAAMMTTGGGSVRLSSGGCSLMASRNSSISGSASSSNGGVGGVAPEAGGQGFLSGAGVAPTAGIFRVDIAEGGWGGYRVPSAFPSRS